MEKWEQIKQIGPEQETSVTGRKKNVNIVRSLPIKLALDNEAHLPVQCI